MRLVSCGQWKPIQECFQFALKLLTLSALTFYSLHLDVWADRSMDIKRLEDFAAGFAKIQRIGPFLVSASG